MIPHIGNEVKTKIDILLEPKDMTDGLWTSSGLKNSTTADSFYSKSRWFWNTTRINMPTLQLPVGTTGKIRKIHIKKGVGFSNEVDRITIKILKVPNEQWTGQFIVNLRSLANDFEIIQEDKIEAHNITDDEKIISML